MFIVVLNVVSLGATYVVLDTLFPTYSDEQGMFVSQFHVVEVVA